MTRDSRILLWISMLLILASSATAKSPDQEPSGDTAPGASGWKSSTIHVVEGVLYIGQRPIFFQVMEGPTVPRPPPPEICPPSPRPAEESLKTAFDLPMDLALRTPGPRPV
jgi:hypothetical protein